ncbi:MAG TPA: ATP-binding protein [Chloroflexota bacterium]|nr:ATP-binding protein [Chloroflexota bacterium]
MRRGAHRQRLQRFRVQARWDPLRQEASAQERPYADFLDRLRSEEVTAQEAKPVAMRTALARCPDRKTLESFACSFQPSGDRKKRQALAACRFLEPGANLVCLGPGHGENPSAIALGLKEQGHRTLFTAAMSLLAARTNASAENRLEERLKPESLPKLLIIDEIGDMPIDPHGAPLFCQLISRRYERGAIGLTAHQSCGQWGEGFGNAVITTAILARLLHHSVVIHSKGDSYRLREKPKAGLLKNPQPALAS